MGGKVPYFLCSHSYSSLDSHPHTLTVSPRPISEEITPQGVCGLQKLSRNLLIGGDDGIHSQSRNATGKLFHTGLGRKFQIDDQGLSFGGAGEKCNKEDAREQLRGPVCNLMAEVGTRIVCIVLHTRMNIAADSTHMHTTSPRRMFRTHSVNNTFVGAWATSGKMS